MVRVAVLGSMVTLFAAVAPPQAPVQLFPVGARYARAADAEERRRDLEEMRRLRFNVVAPPQEHADTGLELIDRLLAKTAGAQVLREAIASVPIRPEDSAARVRLSIWNAVARGARGIVFDDWTALVGNPDALGAAAEFAEHVARNAALYAPLQPRTPPAGAADVAVDGNDDGITAKFLESPEALLLIVTNANPDPREVTLNFSPEMPEAIWQNMLTGAAVNFVAAGGGPVYTRTFEANGVLVLMIRKQWKAPGP